MIFTGPPVFSTRTKPESDLQFLVQSLISSCSLKHLAPGVCCVKILYIQFLSLIISKQTPASALSYTSSGSLTNSIFSGLILILVTVPQLKTSYSILLQFLGYIWLKYSMCTLHGRGPLLSSTESPHQPVVCRTPPSQLPFRSVHCVLMLDTWPFLKAFEL